jgi:hypothetical protein
MLFVCVFVTVCVLIERMVVCMSVSVRLFDFIPFSVASQESLKVSKKNE